MIFRLKSLFRTSQPCSIAGDHSITGKLSWPCSGLALEDHEVEEVRSDVPSSQVYRKSSDFVPKNII
jgi:hypothetical protein